MTPVSGQWQPLAIGGGGYVVGMDMTPSGAMAVRTDTYGANVFDTGTSKWRPVMTSTSMPPNTFFLDAAGNQIAATGVYEIKIAPSNTQVLYMLYLGKMWFSSNFGRSWVQMTNFPAISWTGAPENDNYRVLQKKMLVDPTDANIVYIGTPANGVYRTTNGLLGANATFQRIAGIPAAVSNAGHSGMCRDPNSPNVYIGSYGHGLYVSTDHGNTFSAVAGSPANIADVVVVAGGALVVCGNSGSTIYRYSGGSWSTNRISELTVCVAVNPFDPNNVVLANNRSGLYQSANAGATWTTIFGTWNIDAASSDVKWLAQACPFTANMSAASLWFDPQVNHRIWQSCGLSVLYTDGLTTSNVPSSTPVRWTVKSAGIEQLCALKTISPPNGYPIVSAMDMQQFAVLDPDVYPTFFGITNKQQQELAAGLDYAKSDPSTIATIAAWTAGAGGYSNDKGMTWTPYAAQPWTSPGGCLAAATPTNFVACGPGLTTLPKFTKDRGATWTNCAGLTASGFIANYNSVADLIAADPVNFDTSENNNSWFYIIRNNRWPNAQLLKSTDGGANFTAISSSPVIQDGWWWNVTMKAVPFGVNVLGTNAHLFFCNGGLNGGPHPNTNSLWFSSNGGAGGFVAVRNIREPLAFGFGKPHPQGSGYPSIWIAGWVNQGAGYKYGIWACKDFNPATATGTWTWLVDFPFGSFDTVRAMTGDANDHQKVYFGFAGSGYGYGKNLIY